MHPIAVGALFALQCFHVLFLALHDWIPLGTLNDVKAVRAACAVRKLVAGTVISVTPFVIGLGASAIYFGRAYPTWLFWWLWISYGLLFVGELMAWMDSIPVSLRGRARGALSGDVRDNARFPARAKRHPAEYAACDPSSSDAHHIGCPRRTHSTAAVA